MARRSDGLLALGLLLALVAGIVVLGTVGARRTDPFEIRRSSLLFTPNGTRALYTLLDELGYEVRRHRGSLRAVPPGTATLCILSAPVPLGQEEIRGVVSWVEAGGTLVLTMGGGTLPPTATAANRGSGVGALAHELGIRVQKFQRSEFGFRVHGPLGEADLVDRVRFLGGRVLDGPLLGRPGFRPLVTNQHGIVVAEAPRGRGRLLLFADDSPFTNRMIRDPHNALLLVRLLGHTGRAGPILFDERHQGYGDDRDAAARFARALSETGLGLVILQAALAAGMLLYLAGRRFGTPLPPPRARRRSAVEAAEALGRAYRDAGAAGLAAETLAAGARRRAAPRLGIPPTLPPEEFVARVRASRHPGAGALADALERAARVGDAGRLADRELAASARAVERALRELGGAG